MHPVTYVLAGLNQTDGTSDGTISNLASNVIAACGVIVLAIVAIKIVQDFVKPGAPNEKIKNAALWGVAGIAACAVLAYIPKMTGMGDNFLTGFLG